jgi:flagellar biosynthetic protein FlhB
MADSNAQDKNLPASQRKLDKARAEGQVARSRDLGHFTAVAAGGALLVALAPSLSGWLKNLLMQGLRFDATALQTPTFMTTRMGELVIGLLFVVVPFGVVMMAVAIAGGVAMSGWTWTFKPLAPRFEQFNPLVGITRIFAKAQLIDAMKASALALILGTIGAFYLRSHIDAFVGVLAMPLPAAIGEASQVLLHGLGLLLLALAAFALIDVPLQRHLHAQRQKMSHQELKQEHKELEGNAEVKSKVRARMREMTKRRMMAAVPTADLCRDESDPLCGRAEVRRGHHDRAARRREGRRPARAEDPRHRRRRQGAGAAGAGAGACALRPRRARPRDPGRAVRGSGPSARLRLPAARRAAPGRSVAR